MLVDCEKLREKVDRMLSEIARNDSRPLFKFNFLTLECPEKDLGRATALRNFWAWKCFGDVYGTHTR